MTTKKGLSPILILIPAAFVLGLAAMFLYSQFKPIPGFEKSSIPVVQHQTAAPTAIVSPTSSPEETANWKTYQGEGYSLKYPTDAEVKTATLYLLSRSPTSGFEISPTYKPSYPKYYALDFVLRDNPQNTDAKTLINNFASDIKNSCTPPACDVPKKIADTLKPYKNGVIDGYIFHNGAETDSAVVVLVKNNKTYIFSMTGDQGYITDYGLKILNQILSTFKFL